MAESSKSESVSGIVLDRYLAGVATVEERALVDQWLASSSSARILVEELRTMDAVSRVSRFDWSAMGRRIEEQLDARENVVRPSKQPLRSGTYPLRQRWRPRPFASYPLLLAALVCGVVVAVIENRHVILRHSSAVTHEAEQRYATAIGQQATVTLADGSRVRLAPQTVLQVESGFGTRARSVSLQGEAYFDVPHATGIPFVVHTNAAAIRVLGTTFTVRRYSRHATTQVAVTRGRVSIASPRSPASLVTLNAGMTGVVGDSLARILSPDSVEEASAWVDGQLVFHRAPTTDVLAAITRWYGYQFRLTDSTLAHRTLTLWLSTQSASAALATIKQVLNVDLTFDANVVTLHPRRGGSTAPSIPPSRQEVFSTLHSEVGR